MANMGDFCSLLIIPSTLSPYGFLWRMGIGGYVWRRRFEEAVLKRKFEDLRIIDS
ncbi:MAG: hypothetical protein AABW79_02095 [Nanoarchaeota archaeon]